MIVFICERILKIGTKMDDLIKQKYNKALDEYDNENYQKAFEMFFALAKQNLPEAKLELAYMFYEGQGVEQNLDDALYWFQQVLMDYDEVFRMIGWCYIKLGNHKKGVRFLHKALEVGDIDAFDNLADIYNEGLYGVEVDKNKAIELYTYTCIEGMQKSCLNLGKLLKELNYDKVEYIQTHIGLLKFFKILLKGKYLKLLFDLIKLPFSFVLWFSKRIWKLFQSNNQR